MSTMSYLTMQQEIAARLRMDTNNSDHLTLIKRWINQSQQEIWGRYDWPWAFDREIVQTVAENTTGTVSVAVSGTTVTGSSTTFASTDVGSFIQFSSANDWYKITAVASSTSLTIEAAYAQTSALSAGTFKIRKWFYNTSSSVEKILDVTSAVSPRKLYLVPYREYDLYRPGKSATGNSYFYIPWGYDSSNRWTFTIDPYPTSAFNLEVRFKKKATDLSANTDVSIIPEKWHSTVMIDGALYRGLEYVRTDFQDRRAEVKKAQFEDGIASMIIEAEPTSDDLPVIENSDRRFRVNNVLNLPSKFDARI